MRVFTLRRYAAVVPAWHLRDRLSRTMRQAAQRVAEMNARLDEARALRDRANQANQNVDRSFWIYLR